MEGSSDLLIAPEYRRFRAPDCYYSHNSGQCGINAGGKTGGKVDRKLIEINAPAVAEAE
jgi:hypothetical protein